MLNLLLVLDTKNLDSTRSSIFFPTGVQFLWSKRIIFKSYTTKYAYLLVFIVLLIYALIEYCAGHNTANERYVNSYKYRNCLIVFINTVDQVFNL
jgi:hypothetical protein